MSNDNVPQYNFFSHFFMLKLNSASQGINVNGATEVSSQKKLTKVRGICYTFNSSNLTSLLMLKMFKRLFFEIIIRKSPHRNRNCYFKFQNIPPSLRVDASKLKKKSSLLLDNTTVKKTKIQENVLLWAKVTFYRDDTS